MKIKRYVVFLSVFLLLFILGGGMPQIIHAEEPESGTSYSTELKSLTIGTVKTSGKNYTDFNKYNRIPAMQTKYFYPELLDGENHIYYADVSTNTTNQYLIIAGERKSATATVQIRDLSDPNNLNEKKLEVDYTMGYTGAGVSANAIVVQPENPFITMGSGITPNQVLGSFLTVHYGMSCYEITVTDNNMSTIYYLILDDKGAGITPVAQGYDIDVDYEDVTFLNGETKEKLGDELQYIKANGYAGISKSNTLPNEVQSIRLTLNRDLVTTTYPYVESGTFLKEFYRQNSNYVSINGGEWSRVDGDGTGYSQELVLRQDVNIVQIRSRSDEEVRPSPGITNTINYSTRVVLLYREGENTYTKTAGEDATLKVPIELFRALAPNTTAPGEVYKKYDIYEENGKKNINLKTSDQYLCAKVLPADTNAVISIDGSTQKVGGSYLIKLEPEVVNESNPLSISIIPANGNGEKEEVHDIYIKWEIGGANMETVDITNGTLDQTFSKTTYRYLVTPSGEQDMTFSFGVSEGASISAVTKNGVELDVKKDVVENKITVPADTQELIVTTTALTDGIPYTNTYYFEFPLKAAGISDDTKNRVQALVNQSLVKFNETYGDDLTKNSATYWPVFGYVACNGDLNGKTVFNVEEQSFGQATSWSAVILQLVMCGENPYNYHGINYVEGLLKEQDSQGSFGGWGNNIWALMALDAVGAQYNLRDELINIVSAQAASTTFDLDMRGWALIASSSHKDQAGVEAAIAAGVRGVKNNQIKEGDYSGVFKHPQYDNYNISTHSCVVSGLTATNLDINAELWTNSGKNPLTYLEREEFVGSISKDYLIAIGDIVNGNNVWQRQVLTRDKFNQLVNQAEKVIEATSNGLIKDNLTAKLSAAKEKVKNTDKNTVVGLGEVYYALKNALALADTTIKPDVTIGSDQVQANYVIGLINALPEGFSKDSAEAKNAKLAYYDLNEAQKNLVTNWEKLKDDTESEVDKAAAKVVTDQIADLGTITLEKEAAVTAARAAYTDLTDAQKALVTADTLKILTAAEEKIAALESAGSEADQAAAQKVSDLIAGIKAADQLKAGDKAEIMKIRRAYQALTETQKGLISEETAGKLTAAEAKIGELEKTVPPVKADAAGIEVTGLPEAVKKLVVDDRKDDATVTAAAKKAAEDANMAEVEVITLYGIKPEMTDEELAVFNTDDTRYVTMTVLIPEDKRGAESYRIYHKKTNGDIEWIDPVVSEDGTCLIFKVTSFSDFGIMAKMKAAGETEDQKAAKAVDELITALPSTDKLTLTDKKAIAAARSAYDGLTANQKALVTNLSTLTAVEAKLAELEKAASEADKAAAKKVTDQIAALPAAGSLTMTDKTKVTEARAAYTALTDTQKTLVTNLTTLTAAEAKITELEKVEADKEAVKKVTDQITALGTITKWEQKASVEAARSAYNQLTVAQKALVTTDTLNLLKAAEAAVEKLKPTTGTITIDVERFTIGQGFFVEPVTVSIKEGEKAYEAIQGLVGGDNLIGDSNYLRAIKGADTGTATIPDYIVSKIGGANSASANAYGQKYTGSTLGEFDYSKYSGWMYLVNNVTPSVGINDYVLKDGDVLRFAFTYWGYGTDLTGLEFGTNKVLANIANKDNLLESIAAVNANKAANLSNATIKTAYNAAMSVVQDMTATQKATNDAATALNKAVTDSSGTDKAAAKTVMDKIAALPTVSKLILTDKDAVTAARSAYDALTATQKALVTNLTTLTAAEAKITELEKEAANTANKAAAKSVSDKIAALHSGTALLLGEKADVVAVRIAYNALTEAQKALVTNLSTLVAAEARIAELEKETPVAKDEKTGIEAVGLPAGTAIKVGDESKDTDKTGEALKAAEKQGIKDAKIVSLYAIKPDMSDADLEKFNDDKSSYVTLTIPLSTEQQGYDSYVVYHKKSDGSVEWITPTLSADKKSLIFKVNSFSEFGVVGSKKSTTPGDESVSCSYQTQIENVGWQEVKKDGATSGTFGKSLRLEGIKINVAAEGKDLGVEYQTHVQNIGWQGFKSNGTMSGTEGKALRLEGIQIRLTGKDAAKYDIYYRVHAQNYGWLDWAKNGESAGTEGFGYRLEGIEIKVVEKNAAAPGETEQPFITGNIHINYQTHVQNIGWQELKKDGAMSGTSGQSLRLEGIKINVENAGYDVGVSYQTHVENIGWQDLRTSGKMSGTEGEAKRLEGIRISLTGNDADLCDVYYQVHAQNYGWLNWAKNGESAGTEGFGYRLEGIHIIVVPKGQAAPTLEAGTLSQTFISNN